MNFNNAQKFCKTAFERHRIYVLKKYGIPKPWTNSIPFLNYRFCCTFRQLDKTTQYIIENIIKPHENKPYLWKAIILARYISRIETLEQLDFTSLKNCIAKLRELQSTKQTIVTNAFVCNSGIGNGQFVDKVSYIIHLLNSLSNIDMDMMLRETTELRFVYETLRRFKGVGSFMAYQYICDFKYTRRYLKHTTDDDSWLSYGLGARRGMRRILYGGPDYGKVEIDDAQHLLSFWKGYVNANLKSQIEITYARANYTVPMTTLVKAYNIFSYLEMHNVEHWLCEYDKYCRGGSKKRRYDGRI